MIDWAAFTPGSALTGGLLIGIGLILAGMANPAKVPAFLDLAGGWGPSLALVMGGAIAVGASAFSWRAGEPGFPRQSDADSDGSAA